MDVLVQVLRNKVQRIIMRKLLAKRWDHKGKKRIRLQQCIEEVMVDIKTGLKATVSFFIRMDIRLHFAIVFKKDKCT